MSAEPAQQTISHVLDECCCNNDTSSEVSCEEIDVERNAQLRHSSRDNWEESASCADDENDE